MSITRASCQPDGVCRFHGEFLSLTDREPFPWQTDIFCHFLDGRIPAACSLPTGLGKTSVLAIWLLALARQAQTASRVSLPRRLIYIVNRRTVVDQATAEAERLRQALADNPRLQSIATALGSLASAEVRSPLAISTLRGQFADNAQWRRDPAQPAIIIGTVDMLGSRLLFSGYGCSFRARPHHAGLLGCNTLLVHDEAHLEPAFQQLLLSIQAEQQGEASNLHVMELTATPRSQSPTFSLSAADRRNPVVRSRLHARKGLAIQRVDQPAQLSARLVKLALAHRAMSQAILVFVRKVEDAEQVTAKLKSCGQQVQTLTGTLRGYERDRLATGDGVFARYLPNPTATPVDGTVYLVSTSAGEVGIDLSGDHLVCDLAPFDSLAQRFGRVNRYGQGDARIDLVHVAQPLPISNRFQPVWEAMQRTLTLLQQLSRRADRLRDVSPRALSSLPLEGRQAAFTPAPTVVPLTDMLLDGWSLTSVRAGVPAAPPVADWLHGVSEWEPPQTQIAWRAEVERVTGDRLLEHSPEQLLNDYPLRPHELLCDRTDRVLGHLRQLAGRHPVASVWLQRPDATIGVSTLGAVADMAPWQLTDQTVLLPPFVGGLDGGLLRGDSIYAPGQPYDIADEEFDELGQRRRLRCWGDEPPPAGMRWLRTLDLRDEEDEGGGDKGDEWKRAGIWRWYQALPTSNRETASGEQDLEHHLQQAKRIARRMAGKLKLAPTEARALAVAAAYHDLGKDRELWQSSINNRRYPRLVLAKSATRLNPVKLGSYRHELGSLLDLKHHEQFGRLPAAVRELALHLIAAHHGRGRPGFSAAEAFDPNYSDDEVLSVCEEVPRRFVRLERRYGRWRLAYLESLLRAVDQLASGASEAADV